MTITEFATLELIEPYTLEDPVPLLVTLLGRAADWQASWSSYPLSFFTNPVKPSEIHIITGWKDVAAHEAWIASDQNQELLQKLSKFLTVKGMVHLDINFSLVPTDEQTFICEKYGPWSVVGRHTSSEAEKKREAELMTGSRKHINWAAAGKDLDPKADGAFYRITACTEAWKKKICASETQHKEVLVLNRLDIKALLGK